MYGANAPLEFYAQSLMYQMRYAGEKPDGGFALRLAFSASAASALSLMA
tara:strand:- start:1912 stop:2058 length:147 start_codon:yes stop_codon:yes gene_type:complete